eukprot:3191498-Amphidinium_carterae.1
MSVLVVPQKDGKRSASESNEDCNIESLKLPLLYTFRADGTTRHGRIPFGKSQLMKLWLATVCCVFPCMPMHDGHDTSKSLMSTTREMPNKSSRTSHVPIPTMKTPSGKLHPISRTSTPTTSRGVLI